jgi:hypothetical protein
MVFDGLRAEMKSVGNGLGFFAKRKSLGHTAFAIRQFR